MEDNGSSQQDRDFREQIASPINFSEENSPVEEHLQQTIAP